MLTEDYVSFETAKLLKEKGFDTATFHDYDERGIRWFEEVLVNHNSQGGIACPTLQMAMKWLRETHHIFLSIQQHMDMSYVWYSYMDGVAKGCDRESHNNTYEEACEAAIKYCLENLI